MLPRLRQLILQRKEQMSQQAQSAKAPAVQESVHGAQQSSEQLEERSQPQPALNGDSRPVDAVQNPEIKETSTELIAPQLQLQIGSQSAEKDEKGSDNMEDLNIVERTEKAATFEAPVQGSFRIPQGDGSSPEKEKPAPINQSSARKEVDCEGEKQKQVPSPNPENNYNNFGRDNQEAIIEEKSQVLSQEASEVKQVVGVTLNSQQGEPIVSEEVHEQIPDLELEVPKLQPKYEQIESIVNQMKITSKLTRVPISQTEYDSELLFEIEPLYEIESLLEANINDESKDVESENQSWPQSEVQVSKDQGSNNNATADSNMVQQQRQHSHVNLDSQSLLEEGVVLIAKYTNQTLPQEFSILFQNVEELFAVLKNYHESIYSVEKISEKILLLNIEIFQKKKQFKVVVEKQQITPSDFLKRKNNQLVTYMRDLFDKYRITRKRYTLLRNECKKIESLEKEKEKSFKSRSVKKGRRKKFSKQMDADAQVRQKTAVNEAQKGTAEDKDDSKTCVGEDKDAAHLKRSLTLKESSDDSDGDDEGKNLTPLEVVRRVLKRSLKRRQEITEAEVGKNLKEGGSVDDKKISGGIADRVRRRVKRH